MHPFVSVHMIVKEQTQLGIKFLDACLESLHEASYPNELVIVDNGSHTDVFDLYSTWRPLFENFDCDFKIIKSDCKNFMDLRNTCLDHTSPFTDYFHWIDSDEVYYSSDLDLLKNECMAKEKNVRQIWTYFYHFMINPFMVQSDNLRRKKLEELTIDEYRSSKDNIFGYHQGIRWGKGADGQIKKVHEKVENKKEGKDVDFECSYLHLGYTRKAFETMFKWMHYDYIEHGHINHYKMENVSHLEDGTEVENGTPNSKMTQKEYLRDWRVPNGDFLQDRRKYCTPFPNKVCREDLPESFITLLNGCKNESDWLTYINKLDKDSEFLNKWVEEYNKTKSWASTMDWCLAEAIKNDWSF